MLRTGVSPLEVADMLETHADTMDRLPRLGQERDEPEGARYVQFSDTLLKQLAGAKP